MYEPQRKIKLLSQLNLFNLKNNQEIVQKNLNTKFLNKESLAQLSFKNKPSENGFNVKNYNEILLTTENFRSNVDKQLRTFELGKKKFDQLNKLIREGGEGKSKLKKLNLNLKQVKKKLRNKRDVDVSDEDILKSYENSSSEDYDHKIYINYPNINTISANSVPFRVDRIFYDSNAKNSKKSPSRNKNNYRSSELKYFNNSKFKERVNLEKFYNQSVEKTDKNFTKPNTNSQIFSINYQQSDISEKNINKHKDNLNNLINNGLSKIKKGKKDIISSVNFKNKIKKNFDQNLLYSDDFIKREYELNKYLIENKNKGRLYHFIPINSDQIRIKDYQTDVQKISKFIK